MQRRVRASQKEVFMYIPSFFGRGKRGRVEWGERSKTGVYHRVPVLRRTEGLRFRSALIKRRRCSSAD